MAEKYIHSSLNNKDTSFEMFLRPQALQEFVGQDPVRKRLDIMITAAKQRKEPLGHCLFSGPPGLGKTTLAHILAKAMGSRVIVTSGPVIEKAGDLAGILTNLEEGDILFIDEIHQLPRSVEEYLYPAMEDFSLDLMINSGPHARSVQVKLNRFTLAGATTRTGLLTAPLRSRFGMTCRLDYYKPEELSQIILRTARILNLDLDLDAALGIAKRSRGTPRIANNLLRWVRDFVQTYQHPRVTEEIAHDALQVLEIDEQGLDEMDQRILRTIIEKFEGGPVGVNSLAVSVNEEARTIEDVYEPYLLSQGYIRRTPKGREATHLAYAYLQLPQNNH